MNKVITINLNGRAYQLEESGFDTLRAYLDDASARLERDEGKAEIMSDLEQALAEKCDKVLSPYKTVVTNDEIQKIIDEMGPVEGGKNENASDTSRTHTQSSSGPKRLYLIREGAVLAGVCTGLAAYFNVDVTVMRVIFTALTVFTGGIWILVYILLALIIPYADTIEARAEARGQAFKAQDIVDRAKSRFEESFERFTGTKYGSWDEKSWSEQKHEWKKWKHNMKRERKQQWRQMRQDRYLYRSNPILGLGRVLLALLWIWALVTLVTKGMIFGWAIPAGVPLWAAIILLFIVYQVVSGPLKAAQWRYTNGHVEYSSGRSEWDGVGDGFTVLFLIIAFGWAYLHIPEFYSFVHHPIAGIEEAIAQVKALWNR
jgi:phage shock protein PspC (stress-responsive transcriptional regulator)